MSAAKVKYKFSVFIEVLWFQAPKAKSQTDKPVSKANDRVSTKCLHKHAIHYSKINEDILAAVECGSAL